MSRTKINYSDICLKSNSEAVLLGRGGNIIPPPEREPDEELFFGFAVFVTWR